MTPELQDQLIKKYPKILSNIYLEVGNGWYNIIDNLCEWLQFNTNNNNDRPQVKAVQVKEKFGSLRFYVENASNSQFAVISFVEHLTRYICEQCGSRDNVTQEGSWIKTLCTKCRRNKKD